MKFNLKQRLHTGTNDVPLMKNLAATLIFLCRLFIVKQLPIR